MSDQPPFVFEGQPDREMITSAVRHVSRPMLRVGKAQFVPLPTTSMSGARRAAMVAFLRARLADAGAPRASAQPLPPPTP